MNKRDLNRFSVLMIGLLGLMLTSARAQMQDSSNYPVVIQFNSFGTGAPTDSTIRSSIVAFKKKNKLKAITAQRIGPMGKEGEYWLAFPLTELNNKQKEIFFQQVKYAAEIPTERGAILYQENMPIKKSELSGRVTFEQVVF